MITSLVHAILGIRGAETRTGAWIPTIAWISKRRGYRRKVYDPLRSLNGAVLIGPTHRPPAGRGWLPVVDGHYGRLRMGRRLALALLLDPLASNVGTDPCGLAVHKRQAGRMALTKGQESCSMITSLVHAILGIRGAETRTGAWIPTIAWISKRRSYRRKVYDLLRSVSGAVLIEPTDRPPAGRG